MAYTPTATDIPVRGYQPSAEDIPSMSMPSVEQAKFDPSFLETLAPNILSGMAQFGHSVLNAPSNIAKYAASKGLIKPSTAAMVPRQQDYNYSEMLGLPDTFSNKLVQGATEALPSMLMPGAKLGMIGKGIEMVPAIGKFLSGAASRIAPQAALGAVTNENPAQGSGNMAMMQGAMEGLTAPFHAVGKMAELMNPLKYTENKLNDIRNAYQDAISRQKEAYAPVMEQYGNMSILPQGIKPNDFLGFNRRMTRYFTPNINKALEDFREVPTFENAHELQSQMFNDAAKYKNSPSDLNSYQAITNARNQLTDKLENFLMRDKEALNNYRKGTDITRDEISPFRSNARLRNIAEGAVTSMEPNELVSALKKSTEKKGLVPNDHFIRQALSDMKNKVNVGNIAQYAIPTIGAVAGSEALSPETPLMSGLTGLGAGAALGKFGSPAVMHLAQNPAMLKALENIRSLYFGAGRGLMGYNNSK